MRVLALDLSKLSTGYAVWGPDDARVFSGTWQLGSEYSSDGLVFCKLHERLTDLHRVARIDALFYEDAIDARKLQGFTNVRTLKLASGLGAHAESWGEAMGCRIVRAVNQSTWRVHFVGSQKRPKDERGRNIPIDWKTLAMQRCAQLGFKPQKHDEAEAIGILDHACDSLGIPMPWHQRPQNAGAML